MSRQIAQPSGHYEIAPDEASALVSSAVNKKDDFALVPRPPNALEKAEPGARRILSGMVADTLALAKTELPTPTRPLRIVMLGDQPKGALEAALKIPPAAVERSVDIDMQVLGTRPPRIVVVNDEPKLLDVYEAIIRSCLADVTVLRFDDGEEAWKEVVREDPDLLITDLNRAKFNGFHMLRLLAERKVKYPILVLSGVASSNSDNVKESTGPNLNVTLRQMPFSPDQLKRDLLTLVSPIDETYTDVRKDDNTWILLDTETTGFPAPGLRR